MQMGSKLIITIASKAHSIIMLAINLIPMIHSLPARDGMVTWLWWNAVYVWGVVWDVTKLKILVIVVHMTVSAIIDNY
jgi:hypothetical protein